MSFVEFAAICRPNMTQMMEEDQRSREYYNERVIHAFRQCRLKRSRASIR